MMVILTSLPVVTRCSERSQPKTLSLRMPDFFSLPRVGRDRMNDRRNEISLPCFARTGCDFIGKLFWSSDTDS